MFYRNMLILLLSLTGAQCFAMQKQTSLDIFRSNEKELLARKALLLKWSGKLDTPELKQSFLAYLNDFITDSGLCVYQATIDKDHPKYSTKFKPLVIFGEHMRKQLFGL